MSDWNVELKLKQHLELTDDEKLAFALATAYIVLDDIRELMIANYRTMEAAILTPTQLADYRRQMIPPSLRRLDSIGLEVSDD